MTLESLFEAARCSRTRRLITLGETLMIYSLSRSRVQSDWRTIISLGQPQNQLFKYQLPCCCSGHRWRRFANSNSILTRWRRLYFPCIRWSNCPRQSTTLDERILFPKNSHAVRLRIESCFVDSICNSIFVFTQEQVNQLGRETLYRVSIGCFEGGEGWELERGSRKRRSNGNSSGSNEILISTSQDEVEMKTFHHVKD